MLVNIFDKQIEQLSKMQVELIQSGIDSDNYNKISDMIGDLKDYMLNCQLDQ